MQVFAPQARQIQRGDVFRLFTDDPARLPLPYPFLVSLHALLWEMIGSAGLGETSQEKRRTHGYSDDSGDDSGWKRTRQGSRRARKTKATPQPALQQPAPPGSSTQEAGNKVTPLLVDSAQNPSPRCGHTAPVPSGMMFLEREYRDFKLRQVLAAEVDLEIEERDSDKEVDESCQYLLPGGVAIANPHNLNPSTALHHHDQTAVSILLLL